MADVQDPLRRYPGIRTRNPDELLEWLRPVYAIKSVDMPLGGREFESVLNHRELTSVALTYARYGSPIDVRLTHNDFFVQGFPIAGSGEIRWNRESHLVERNKGGVAGGPGSEAHLSYGADFRHLIFKTSPGALTAKLSALTGVAIEPAFRLTGRANVHTPHAASLFRLMMFVVGELDHGDPPLSSLATTELEQALLVNFLLANESNYSHMLHEKPRAAAPWQVRRAVDYIEANWDVPITIEELSRVTQTTARSLFHLFGRTYGHSPMVYVNRVRLNRAREMLRGGTDETTVTSVGFICGFSNMGHFARKYYEAFGEKPSDTLRANR